MPRLVIVRHGETDWNRVERFRGRVDLDLNETGLRQAEAAAARIAGWEPKAVYSSPLRRAWHTAEVIAQPLGLEVRPVEGITDVDYGEWQGLSPEEASERDTALFDLWQTQPHRVQFPGGEGLTQVQERAMAAVRDLLSRHGEETVVLVSHTVVCRLMVLGLLQLDASHFWKIRQDVAAINFFETRDGMPIAIMLNDTCHLKFI